MFSFSKESFEYTNVFKYDIFHENKEIGFFLLLPHSSELWEVHTEIYREAWGSSYHIAKEWLDFIFSTEDKIKTLITKVPINNPLAKKLAIRSGFVLCGLIPESFLTSSGISVDQEIFYLSRKEK